MMSWHLELGRVDQRQLSIEHLGRELVLGMDPPVATAAPSPVQIAMVQPGVHLALQSPYPLARSLTLPWASAPLDDLWLLVSGSGSRSWLEVPYGLCRSPDQQDDAPQLGPPRPPSDAKPGEVVLTWKTIRFTLGRVSGWQLAVLAREGRPGEIELSARRTEPGAPPEIALTAVTGRRFLSVDPHEPWSAEPGQLHVARYRFAPPPLRARSYVQLLVASGGATFELDLPTSLTDPGHRSIGRRTATP